MNGDTNPPRPRRRRRIGWILPLIGAPVVLFVGLFVAGSLDLLGAPEILWRVPWALAIAGSVAAIIVFLVEVVRSLSPAAGRLAPDEDAAYEEYVRLFGEEKEPHQSTPSAVGTRRHRSWVLPLLTVPAIIITAVLIILVLRSVDAPREAIRTVSFTMLVGIILTLGVLVVGVVRFFRSPPKPRAARAPRSPRRPDLYDELSSADAAQRGLTREEYGVYKGDIGSIVQPVNSAGGLLFIAILLTVLNGFLLVLVFVIIAQANGLLPRNSNDHPLGPVQWVFFVLEILTVPIAWRYYFAERRAQKLRVARGLPSTLR